MIRKVYAVAVFRKEHANLQEEYGKMIKTAIYKNVS